MTDQAHTWKPLDLAGVGDDPPAKPTMHGIAYPGLRHLISGEPESGKTWVALVLASLEIKAGRAVFWFDFNEMGAAAICERLAALAITADERDALFLYFEPAEGIGDESRADLEQLIVERQPTLAVVDAYIGALELHGLDPYLSRDVQRFQRVLVSVMLNHGAAVVLIDHVVKAKDQRRRFSTGSERKLGAVEVHLGLEVIRPFGRGRNGLAKVMTHKDRPGWLPRPKAAEFELTANEDGTEAKWALRLSDGTEERIEPAAFRPTTLMEHVSRYLARQAEPVSRNSVESNVKGKSQYVRLALDTLIEEGYASSTPGPHGAQLVASARIYRERDEDDPVDPLGHVASDVVLARPHFVPTSSQGEGDDVVPRPPPPRRDEDEVNLTLEVTT